MYLLRGFAVALALVSVASSAHADERAIADAVHVSTSKCLEGAPLAAQIASWLKSETIDARLEVTVEGDAHDVKFRVTRDGERVGERTFRTENITCTNLTALVALAIAMAIDATPLTSRDVPVSEQPPRIEPSKRESNPFAPFAPIAPRDPFVTFSALAAAGVLVAVAPDAVLVTSVAIDARFTRNISARMGAMATTSASTAIDRGSAAISIAAGVAAICVGLPSERVTGRLCGGLALGQLVATGAGFDVSSSTRLVWLDAILRAEVEVHLARGLGLFLAAEQLLSLPPVPHLLVVRGGATIDGWSPPAAGFAIQAGPTLHFQ